MASSCCRRSTRTLCERALARPLGSFLRCHRSIVICRLMDGHQAAEHPVVPHARKPARLHQPRHGGRAGIVAESTRECSDRYRDRGAGASQARRRPPSRYADRAPGRARSTAGRSRATAPALLASARARFRRSPRRDAARFEGRNRSSRGRTTRPERAAPACRPRETRARGLDPVFRFASSIIRAVTSRPTTRSHAFAERESDVAGAGREVERPGPREPAPRARRAAASSARSRPYDRATVMRS